MSAPLARYGRNSLIVLALIVAVGFGLRLEKVVNPLADPGDDAFAYRALAESLYEEGSYGGENFDTPSDWSPGAPLLYAAAYYATGGVRDGVARGVQAVLGTLAIVIVFLLTARLTPARAGPLAAGAAPLLAAGMVAVYPPFIHSTGALMSEPPAIFTLPAAVLAFIWADGRAGRPGGWWAWLAPGLLFGLTALIRPEYLFVAVAFAAFALIRAWVRSGAGRGLLAGAAFALAMLVPIVPWTIHNYQTLDRVVPISTGSGKALFVGTYLPADGEYQRVKADLYEQQTGIRLEPDSDALDEIDPVPLFDRVAEQYPGLSRDNALGRVGRDNLEQYLADDPVGYAGMTVRKVWRMWSSGIGEAMSSTAGRVVQVAIVLAGIAGLLLLAWRKRWEAIAMALPILLVSAIGAATLAPPRRNEILMTLVLPLAALAFCEAADRLSGSRRSETQDPSPEPT
jgi:hypothetical protein